MHCSLPRPPCAHPAAVPCTPCAEPMFRLCPFGPVANTKNFLPAFAEVKLNSASIRPHVRILNAAFTVTAGVPLATANTLVTFGDPSGRQKHAPLISTSSSIPHGPEDGVTLNMTGARIPRSIVQNVVRVNGPNMLLRPAVKVVVTVNLANPPQHAAGKPEQFNNCPCPPPAGGNTDARTRLQLIGVTFPSAMTASLIPSPLKSHASVTAVDTTLPGSCSGTPVSSLKPWQTIVFSFGKNPQPRMFNCTWHTALMIPDVGVAIRLPLASLWLPAAADPTSGCPCATGTVPTGVTSRHVGLAGGPHDTPRKQIFPRFASRCRIGVHNCASLPSNLRSKSGVANVICPIGPMFGPEPSLNSSNNVGSVPSPMQQLQNAAVVPWITENGVSSAAFAAVDRLISHSPGGVNPLRNPIEYPTSTEWFDTGVPSNSIRQYSKVNIPLPSGLGGQPMIVPVVGSVTNLRSVGPSRRSNGTALFPIGFTGFSGWFAFSSIPVPSSNRFIENVFPPIPNPLVAQRSESNSGTSIQRILKSLTPANPRACTGNVNKLTLRDDGLRSTQAGAILGGPVLNSGTVGVLSVSPAPNVMLPFEFRKNPFHTQAAVPTGPPKRNSNPPLSGPASGGVPAPSSSSPENGEF